MTDTPDQPPPLPPATPRGGNGCLFGLLAAVLIPVAIFSAIAISNHFNPQCGTPADSGGCEMGLAAGTIVAVVIGLVVGIIVAVVMNSAGRSNRG
jgi:hypothetical protein